MGLQFYDSGSRRKENEYRMAAKWLCLTMMVSGCITSPCTMETRQYAKVQQWNVICLPVEDGWQWCARWPVPPEPPAWIGNLYAMQDSGVVFRSYQVCHEADPTYLPPWVR